MYKGNCPNCGGNELDGRFCAYCGTQLLENAAVQDRGILDLNQYFDQYHPNRVKAVKALRRDTGMGLVESKNLIDQVFDERLHQDHDKDWAVAGRNLKDAIKEMLHG